MMTTTAEALDHETLFQSHPLDGDSRFSLLGLLAGLHGLSPEQLAGQTTRNAQALFGLGVA